ncbi:hypothetical protein FB561_5197 [Kribbella amoyensis]|uniref:Uncharacterized protein n=1 Tax=Kribbella amoyensis TaxID=996641 RepID=A0A561BYP6_9ACTN|nr:hypothetical protein [Kribbella amoyensis]TWD84025.1 hypothetical protein FB561_5197 [Kribbella amoyensis]
MKTAPDDFDPIPSTRNRAEVGVGSLDQARQAAAAIAVPVSSALEPPEELGTDAAGLAAAGFTGKRGETLVLAVSPG